MNRRRQASVLVLRYFAGMIASMAPDLPVLAEEFERMGLAYESLIEQQAKELGRDLAKKADALEARENRATHTS